MPQVRFQRRVILSLFAGATLRRLHGIERCLDQRLRAFIQVLQNGGEGQQGNAIAAESQPLENTYSRFAQSCDCVKQLSHSGVRMFDSVQVAPTRLKKATSNVDVGATKIITAPLDTSESDNRRGNPKLC